MAGGEVLAELRREDWEGATWEPAVRSRYSYDAQGIATERLAEVWTGSDWINARRDLYTYNDADLLVLEVAQNWVDDTWWDVQRELYSYEEGLLVEYVRRECAGPSCENVVRERYTYDGGSLPAEFVLQFWEGTAWEDFYRELFDYDADGLRTVQLRQGWIDGGWVNLWRVLSAYDGGFLVEAVREYWDGMEWDARYRDSYTYDSELLVGALYEYWDRSGWENTIRLLYAYDGEGFRTEQVRQLWTEDEWGNDARSLYDHDEGLQTEEIRQEWDGSAWENDVRFLYTYVLPTGVDGEAPEPSGLSLSVYPNPAIGAATVAIDLSQAGIGEAVHVAVFDVLGREVAVLHVGPLAVGTHLRTLDAGLPAGAYVVRVTGGGAAAVVQRFTVVR